MSTKIYNGCEIQKLSAYQLFQELRSIRQEAQEIVTNEYAQWFIGTWVELVDNASFKQQDNAILPATVIKQRRDTLQEFEKYHRIPSEDWDFSLFFTACPYQKENRWLGILNVEKPSLKSLILSKEWCKEYGYWNNSDELPDNVDKKQWKHRGQEWDMIFDRYTTIGECMAEFTIVSNKDYVHPSYDKLYQHAPEDEKRVNRLVRRMALDEIFVQPHPDDNSAYESVKQIHDFNENFESGKKYWYLRDKYIKTAQNIVAQKSIEEIINVQKK